MQANHQYFFQLGTMRELCFAELESVFPQAQRFSEQVAKLELTDKLDCRDIVANLGGTVKLAQGWQTLPKNSSETKILTAIATYLSGLEQAKIHFAISELGRDHLERLDVIGVKKELVARGLKVRFADRSRHDAGSALLLHHPEVVEILVIQSATEIALAHTRAVQDIDEWTRRDRTKPYANHKKGMLPPKLARQMVNLAQLPAGAKVWDPFCGTGTILMEAVMAGATTIYGSDLDPQASAGTQANLDWLMTSSSLSTTPVLKIFTADATHTTLAQLGNQPLTTIITEPFLGKQTPRPTDLPNIFRGLEKLYWGAFRSWQTLLAPQAKIVIVFPHAIGHKGQTFNLDGLLDKLQAIGYTKHSQNLEYARPGALIKREICVFEYQPKSNN